MKRTTKKTLVFATAVAILYFAAPGAQAGGMHDVRTSNSPTKKFSNSQASKKYGPHKRRKSSKSKQSKDRSSSSVSMDTQKDT